MYCLLSFARNYLKFCHIKMICGLPSGYHHQSALEQYCGVCSRPTLVVMKGLSSAVAHKVLQKHKLHPDEAKKLAITKMLAFNPGTMSFEVFHTLTQITPILTNERVSESLTAWFKEKVTFTHWEYVSDTGKGDSYLSELIRIKIYGSTETDDSPKHVQVVLKTIPKNTARRLTFRSNEFFKNEINFYQICLPALLKFQAKKKMTDPFDKYAKLFLAYSDGRNDVIALEDAALENFGSAVRQEGIDYEHCRLTFKVLAQYHAMSFAMKDQEPQEFDRITKVIKETYYDESVWEWYQRFWARICGIAIDAVEKEYPNSIYVEKIKEFAVPERYKKMIEAVKDKTHAVLSHGDSWTNNFLYKYVNDRPIDAKIIDFQLARYASPVLDITFVVYACTSQEMRVEHYKDLLKYYYEVLSTQINEMGSDADTVYSWDAFMGEIKKYSFFGLAFSFESTPFIVLSPEDAVNMEMEGDEKLNIDDFWQIKPFKTKEGRLREANNVVHCVDNGYI